MSFTSPTPLGVEAASVCAAAMDSAARANAVWNPKLWSMYGMSLSIVLGTPTTARGWSRAAAASAMRWAPRSVPSPPMTNRMQMPRRSRVAAMSSGSWSPREVPRTVPPRVWMPATSAGVSGTTSPLTSPR